MTRGFENVPLDEARRALSFGALLGALALVDGSNSWAGTGEV